jgi:hypothetical protein|tara:strand:- start:212 stop:664 length:453 start_codon:yes stop_codon:yes gene_type:complete
MITNSANLILSILIATCLVILQETMSNIFWLISIDMPVSLGTFISTYFSNLYAMNLSGAVPLIALIGIGFLIAYLVTKIILIWVNVPRSYAYALAGAAAVLAIVLLMPLAFYNLDILAGGRSTLGKSILTFFGLISGYYFGKTLDKQRAS